MNSTPPIFVSSIQAPTVHKAEVTFLNMIIRNNVLCIRRVLYTPASSQRKFTGIIYPLKPHNVRNGYASHEE